MSKRPASNITMPSVSIDIDGATYHMCFTFAAISAAKAELVRIGNPTRILQALMFPQTIDVDAIPALFYASLIAQHPKIKAADVAAMITMENFEEITLKVFEAYAISKTPAKETEPGNGLAAE
jgi:hypothetical protein